ncbi:MAG: phenylalanine--tRNA ligase subunit alpha [Candidatus Aenigmatarchaeota archaeon]
MSIMYRLTEEGKKYLEEGLPERKLLELLEEEGEAKMESIGRKIENSSIAINWALKNGWVEVSEGVVELKESPGSFGVQEALKNVDSEEDVSGEMVEILEDRNLIEEVREDVVKRAKEQLKEGKIAGLTPELIKTGLWREADFKEYDVKKTGKEKYPGRRHVLTHFIRKIRRIFLEMGFEERRGPYVESSFWNFDALFQPQDHPARELADTFYLKNPKSTELPEKELVEKVKEAHEKGTDKSKGWGYNWDEEVAENPVLRTHTTAVSVRNLAELSPPTKVFTVDKVFRNETVDYSHLPEFIQVEGIAAGESVSFDNLLGYLKEFYRKLGFDRVRFRPGYFPYTEMSVEPEVYFEERDEWLEMGGSGIFRPEVTKPLGIDVPVLAWGLSLERPVMLNLGVDDIRKFYFENDLDFLKRTKV